MYVPEEWYRKNTCWKTVKCAYWDCDEWIKVPYIRGRWTEKIVFCPRHEKMLD